MTPNDLKDAFRAHVDDARSPYLWSDDEIFLYMNEAQNNFCRFTGGIPDATSDITKIDLVAGEAFSPISPKLLKIRRANLRSDGRDITLLNIEDAISSPMQDYGTTYFPRLDNSQGPVTSMILGMDEDKVRLAQIPLVDDTIDMVIYRLPFNTLTESSAVFEIPAQHHASLMFWMEFLAFSKPDVDTYDAQRAVISEDRFYKYCVQARIEIETRKHKPRTVSYGGI